MVTRAAGTGPISLSDINVELGKNSTDTIGLAQLDVRQLSRVNAPPFQMFNLFSKYRGATIYGLYVFGQGWDGNLTVTNKVSTTGSIGADVTIVSLWRTGSMGSSYGLNKGIVAYGIFPGGSPAYRNASNLISDTGSVASDTSVVGTARAAGAATKYGYDKAIIGYGEKAGSIVTNLTNLVSNTGVIANDVSTTGTVRYSCCAAPHSYDKAVFAYGGNEQYFSPQNSFNLVTNVGVLGTDTTSAGTARYHFASAGYGDTKAAFFGGTSQTPSINYSNTLSLMENGTQIADVTNSSSNGRAKHSGVTYNVSNASFAWGDNGTIGSYLAGALRLNSSGSFTTSSTNIGTARTFPSSVAYSSFV